MKQSSQSVLLKGYFLLWTNCTNIIARVGKDFLVWVFLIFDLHK